MSIALVIAAAAGLLLGGVAAYAHTQSRLARLSLQARTQDQMIEALRATSSQVMAETSEHLLSAAEQRYARLEQGAESRWQAQGASVTEYLARIGERVDKIEVERTKDSSALREQVTALHRSTVEVGRQAGQLEGALRDSRARGAWGEVQLARVLELSGLESPRDYVTQSGTWDGEGSGRPDVVVHLPNDRRIVIDAKAPCDRFLDSAGCDDVATRDRLLADHARTVLGHAQALSKRNYASQVGGAVDFVVMFLPGEPFWSAALEARPSLFEEAARLDVLIVTPTSLHALLRTVAIGWREHRLAVEAADIARLGAELYERGGTFAGHYAKVGKGLAAAVAAFNDATGSLESRVLPSARRMGAFVNGKEIVELAPVDLVTRVPSAPELSSTTLVAPELNGRP